MSDRTRAKFESSLSPNTLWLVHRLIKTDQAKAGLVIFMGKVLGIEDHEALTFFKFYKEYVDELQPIPTPAS